MFKHWPPVKSTATAHIFQQCEYYLILILSHSLTNIIEFVKQLTYPMNKFLHSEKTHPKAQNINSFHKSRVE